MFRSRCLICAESKQDTGTEIVEVTVSISDTFQYLDCIIATLGKAVRILELKALMFFTANSAS